MGAIFQEIRRHDARWRPSKRACPYVPKTTFHNRDTTDNAFAPPTPTEPLFAGSAHLFRSAAPLLAHQIRLAAAHTAPAMRSRDPCSSATQRSLTAAISCFNSMHLAPECTHAGTPSRAPIYRKYLRAGLTFAHVCTRPCSLVSLGPGSLKKTEVTDRALVRCLGIEAARVGLDLRTEPRRLESAPWRSRRSASRCKPLALGLVAPGPTHLTF